MNVTLDGFMSGVNCELDWHFKCWNGEMAETACKQLSNADTILLGRVTYLAMARYWPFKAMSLCLPREDIDFAEMMNSYTKIVFSKTLSGVQWCNSRLVKDDMGGVVARLKKQPGRDMIIYGSGRVVSEMIRLGLVDEYQIWMHPVVLGKGKPLFKNLHLLNLNLLKVTTFSSGVVLLHFEPKVVES